VIEHRVEGDIAAEGEDDPADEHAHEGGGTGVLALPPTQAFAGKLSHY
jgi:hypothetical protein